MSPRALAPAVARALAGTPTPAAARALAGTATPAAARALTGAPAAAQAGALAALAAAARAGALAALAALAACQPNYGPVAAHIRMQGTPPDAVVTVDDRQVGTLAVVARRGLAVEPGRHRISVERPGYFPWDAEIEADEKPVQLSVRLERMPD